MNAKIFPNKIKIASPCSARWEDMSGNGQRRFCARCQKHVYNFSTMTGEQVQELLAAQEGRLCARLYQRADGTVLTADCPMRAERVWTKAKALVCSLVAFAMVSCAVLFVRFTKRSPSEPRNQTRIEQEWDRALWTVKGWLGLNPPPTALMGDICIPTPPIQTSLPSTTNSARELLGEVSMPPSKTPETVSVKPD